MPKNSRGRTAKRQANVNRNAPSQHFTTNKQLISSMLEIAETTPPQPLAIDIGAGFGALTLPLAQTREQVWAVERDSRLAAKLRRRTETMSNIKVIEQDFLQIRLPRVPFDVVANIPFAITTGTLRKLMDNPVNSFQRAVLITEFGAAKRFTRNPITDPRILSWRIWFDLDLLQPLSPQNFSPAPRVAAAILQIRRRQQPIVVPREHQHFLGLAKQVLHAPHAPLGEAFRHIFTPKQIRLLLRNLGLERDAPICSLTESQWGIVYLTMRQHVPPERWPKALSPIGTKEQGKNGS